MKIADKAELDAFLSAHPEVEMLELLMPDMNGMLRCKRIHRREFDELFGGGIKSPQCLPLINTRGDLGGEVIDDLFAGDPDHLIRPVAGSLAIIPWLSSPTAQVMVTCTELDGRPSWVDPRNVLDGVVSKLKELELAPVVATEMEFYLIAAGDGDTPRALLGKVPGTGLDQPGTQYCVADDLWQVDELLNDIRLACELQKVPLTVMHSEFSPGQWEINTHHSNDPILACDHAALLKRIVKGVALKHGHAACFMAKPFADIAGSGMHVHASLYDGDGTNAFAGGEGGDAHAISPAMRYAIGGLAESMADSMAVFSPNANSYRRFVPGAYVPMAPTWAYNHRDVALRIPVSSRQNCRIEHRVAGADANPYLVMALVLGGMHHGITQQCDPGPEIAERSVLPEDLEVSLPVRWGGALDAFRRSSIIPQYFGQQYFGVFHRVRQDECDVYHAAVPNLDYEWYLRAV